MRGKSGQVNFKMPDEDQPMYEATIEHFGKGVQNFWLSLYREYVSKHGPEIARAWLASIEEREKELASFRLLFERIVGET